MSDKVKQKYIVEGQEISLNISLVDGAKFVSYEFSSPNPMHPMTLAVAMLRIVQSICIDNKVDVRDLLDIPKTENVSTAKKLH